MQSFESVVEGGVVFIVCKLWVAPCFLDTDFRFWLKMKFHIFIKDYRISGCVPIFFIIMPPVSLSLYNQYSSISHSIQRVCIA